MSESVAPAGTPDGSGSKRTMGIDYGLRRLGIAISDPSGILATPLTTLVRRRNKRPPIPRILELAAEHNVGRFVVGLPLTEEGDENQWTRQVRLFGERLAGTSGLPVAFMDERCSSAEALHKLRLAGRNRGLRQDKGRIDAGAAAIILQDWLDERAATVAASSVNRPVQY